MDNGPTTPPPYRRRNCGSSRCWARQTALRPSTISAPRWDVVGAHDRESGELGVETVDGVYHDVRVGGMCGKARVEAKGPRCRYNRASIDELIQGVNEMRPVAILSAGRGR